MSERDRDGGGRVRLGAPRLGRSGLAEDVLGALEKAVQADAPSAEVPAAPHALPALDAGAALGPERVYAFADALVALDADGTAERRVVEPLEAWVAFALASERFALPVSHVQEILRVGAITRVPNAPRPVRGVTNLRGRVLPVVDLRVRLGLVEAPLAASSRILVVSARRRLLGLLVDGVYEVLRLARSRLEPPPPDVMTEQSDYILGVYHLPDTLVILLDVERVLLIKDEAPATPAEHAAPPRPART